MRLWILILAGLCWISVGTHLSAAENIHLEIDKLVAARFAGQQPSAQTDDAAFLRRIWLDFAGRIPNYEQAQKFLADKSPDKRIKLIDQLLAAPTYQEHMENVFHIVLLERRGDNPEWRKFLRTSFEKNLPWNEIVKHILSPDDQDESMRGAAHFYTQRLKSYGQNPVDFPGLTRDVGRLLLGVDLQCAQCHNHLFIKDYDQQEFQGLFAIYQTLSVRREKFPAVAEKPITEKLEFVSVFDPTKRAVGPKIPFGKEFELPKIDPEAAKKKSNPKDPKKDEGPKFSALKLIAENLPTSENVLFSKTIVNRLWFLMMGRGLVEPLDQFHSENPPSHPELLDLLAKEFTAHNYDIKWMLRQLALTDVYQRSSLILDNAEAPSPETYLVAIERRMSAEQLLISSLIATGNYERLSKPQEKETETEANKNNHPETDPIEELKKRYLKAFANEAREPEVAFTPSVKAALFMLNDEKALELVRTQTGNLVEQLTKINNEKERTDKLFLSVFTRLPSETERKQIDTYLTENADRLEEALGHVIWGMISSIEFCINH